MDIAGIVDVVTLAGLALGALAWRSLSSGAEQAAKDQATAVVAQVNWQAALKRELEQIRGTERQELRFRSYGKLWSEMRPLAIYDDSSINRATMKQLSNKLSDWYFSEEGGLLLTTHNRDLYFALQDLLNAAGSADDWEAERTQDLESQFLLLLKDWQLEDATTFKDLLKSAKAQDWPSTDLEEAATGWRRDIEELAHRWPEVPGDQQFAVLQQVSSALRTGLANDVESRLR